MSAVATVTDINNAAPAAARLIDLDGNKHILLKKVIVFGELGSGVEAAATALKQLGYKVYDAAEAAENFKRDFPLWLEAAELKQAGKPYSKWDFEKLLGRYDAIVGGPATYFAQEMIEAFPYAKFVLLTGAAKPASVENYRHYANSSMLSLIDPTFFGYHAAFLDIVSKDTLNHNMIRTTVRKANLLEVNVLDSWKPLCDFAGKSVPAGPIPSASDYAATAPLMDRFHQLIFCLGTTFCFQLTSCAMLLSVASAGYRFGRFILGADITVSSIMSACLALLVIARLIITDNDPKKPELQKIADTKPAAVVKAAATPGATLAKPAMKQQQHQNSYRNERGRSGNNPSDQRFNNRRQGRNQPGRNQQGYGQQGRNQHAQVQQGRRTPPRNRNQSTSSSGTSTVRSAWSAKSSAASSATTARDAVASAWGNFHGTIRSNDMDVHQQGLARAEEFKDVQIEYVEHQVVRRNKDA